MQENKEALEYLMTVVDQAERALTGDSLAEVTPECSYEFTFPENRIDASDCTECPLWRGRTGREPYINFSNPVVLSVIGAAEPGRTILRSDAMTMYENMMTNVLGLQRSQRALTSIIKCPTDTFEHANADKCKPLLKHDIEKLDPGIIILFGTETARYMLRQSGPFDALRASKRGKPFMLMGRIPMYVTYSQRECINNPVLKKAVFEDLKKIKEAIN